MTTQFQLTEAEQAILLAALVTYRDHLEDRLFRAEGTTANTEHDQAELAATDDLYEHIIYAHTLTITTEEK